MDPSQTGQLTVVLIQTAAAWFMTGLIWTMQVLNYPLLALIDPVEYQGRDLVARFLAAVPFRERRTYRLVATRANGQLAFGAMTRFDYSVLPRFGLPGSLPD
jgi:hypothetical protein